MSETKLRTPRARFDDQGRIVPFTPAERAARAEALRQAIEKMQTIDNGPEEDDREFFRAMDGHRPEAPLFEGKY